MVISPDLNLAQKLIYEPCGFVYENVLESRESKDYGACDFEMNSKRIKFRTGKITPNKIGHFVTLWKRINGGPIMPYDMADPFDLCVISVKEGDRFGQFVFPKSVLYQQDIISKEGKGGKRAMRVYPAWNVVSSPQAKKTQSWQLMYFFEIDHNKAIDQCGIKKLFL